MNNPHPTQLLVDRLRELGAYQPEAIYNEINEAADALERMDALLCAMQADMVAYLVPDSPHNADWLVGRILYHLDGPEQRAAQDGVTKN